jgi:hypothetical protein
VPKKGLENSDLRQVEEVYNDYASVSIRKSSMDSNAEQVITPGSGRKFLLRSEWPEQHHAPSTLQDGVVRH